MPHDAPPGLNLYASEWRRAEPLGHRIATLRLQAGTSASAAVLNCQNIPARANRWLSQFPFTNRDLFIQRLAAAQITEETFLRILDDDETETRPVAEIPEWLQILGNVYCSAQAPVFRLSDDASGSGNALFSFLRSVEPIINYFVTRLRAQAIELAREYDAVPFEPQTVHQMFVGGLLDAFQRMLAPTMILQLNLARLQHALEGQTPSERFQSFTRKLGDRAFVIQILKEYPVLARQLICRGNQWLEKNLQFLRDLSEDWPELQTAFAPGTDRETRVCMQARLGDSHRGGRSVLAVCFNSGHRMIYKPRSLDIDVHFQAFLGWLNLRVQDLTFKTLTLHNRGKHGWVEYVHPGSCASGDGVRRFYERQGGFLAVFYLLGGSDFHCENVIASGEHPVFVDVEALFHDRIETRSPGVHGIATEFWENSVLRTGLLPISMRFCEDMPPLDRSGLGAAPSQVTPFAALYPEASGTDEMQLVRQQKTIRPSFHWPTIEGKPVQRLDVDAVVWGFRKVYGTFLTHRTELLDASGPVARFRDDEVRIVPRHTIVYSRLLAESFHPDVLGNALDRDQMFDLLWGDVDDTPYLGRIVGAECHDLWDGDVPFFTGCVGSRDIFDSTGERITDFLREPSDEPVLRRIRGLSENDLEKQIWVIRATLTTLGADRVRMSRSLTGAVGSRRNESKYERLIGHACSIGNRLEALATISRKEAGWIGLRHGGKEDWSVRPLGPELYEGTAGIVLFLAYLAAITKEDRYQRLALAGAANLKQQASNARGLNQSVGAFSGWGGLVYVYSHLAALWNSNEYIEDAHAMVDHLLPLIDEDVTHDIIGGAAGCASSLLVLNRLVPSEAVASAAIRCGKKLVRSARPAGNGLAWSSGLNDLPLAGFSHGAAGIAWTLLMLSRLGRDGEFEQTALAALEYERSLFDPGKGNWADLRPQDRGDRATDSSMTAWCHGAGGIGLSRLSMLTDENSAMAHRELAQAVKTTLAWGFGDNHSLCHGDLGNLDFLFQASEAVNSDIWRGDVERTTERILDDIEQNGWKCGNGKPVETPGLMTGLAGIGYGMLRLAAPQLVPSVLNLSPPASDLLFLLRARQTV